MDCFEFLKSKIDEADAIYVNHTNRFFSEYVDVSRSSRFLLTGFSGSAGDALVTKDKIHLFVDSRYWEQAELECDLKIIDVVKVGQALPLSVALQRILNKGAKIKVYEDKTSFSQFERFEKLGFKPILTDVDYVEEFNGLSPVTPEAGFIEIPVEITGKSADEKIKLLQDKLAQNEVMVISSLEDVSYLLNLRAEIFEYSSSIFGKIIITKNDYKFYTDDTEFEKGLSKLSSDKNFKFLIDKKSLSVKYKKYFTEFEQAVVLSLLRSIKTNSEIEHLKSAFHKTDKVLNSVFEAVLKNEKPFTEKELYDFVNENFLEFGAQTNSFKTILASGKNSSIVHFSHPTERKIKKGDFILLDCGGLYDGYATDITRTFVLGEPDNEQIWVYTHVLKAFLMAYNADLTKFKTCFEIDNIAREYLNKIIETDKGRGFNFGHGLGHSVGRCVHDGLPTVSYAQEAKLSIKKNMVFTIEPGLYKPDWGGVRLENTIHVTEYNGALRFESFSKAPFQKCLIDFSLLNDVEKSQLNEWELI